MPTSAKPRLVLNRPRSPQAALTLLLLAAGLAVSAQAASAATLMVTSTADDGSAGTFRSQIAAANAGDTIMFSVTGTISIGNVGPLTVNKSLTIAGPGASSLSVSAGNQCQVFLINNTGATVAVSGITVTGGYTTSSAHGGGIDNDSTLTLTNCTVSSNELYVAASNKTPVNGYGGGVYSDGLLTLNGCTITGNYAYGSEGFTTYDGGDGYGGGVACTDTLVMTNCMVTNNVTQGGYSYSSATNSGGAYGGGVWAGGMATLTGTTISSNFVHGGSTYSTDDGDVGNPGDGYGGWIRQRRRSDPDQLPS